MKKLLILVVFLLNFTSFSFSQKSFTGTSGGNWNTGTNWTPSGIPASTDDVTIPDNKSVVINTAAVCKTLTMGSGNANTTISFSLSSNSLTINDALTILTVPARNGQTRSHQITVGASSINCGSIIMEENGGDEQSIISITTGTLTVRGDITMNSTSSLNQINITSTGRINIKGNFNANGSFSPGTTSTIAYNGIGNQNIRSTTYANLIIDSTGTKSIVDNVIVKGLEKTLTIEDVSYCRIFG
jgi:hypothetical protein